MIGRDSSTGGETRVTEADLGLEGAHDRARVALVVYDGERTRVVEIDDGVQLIVGRARTADLCIANERVSRRHARLWRRGGELWIEDLASRNKTWIDGVAIADVTRVVSGTEIAIGSATLVASLSGVVPVLSAPGIVADTQMRRVFDLVRKVASHAITVLVYGETGVGKERIAAAIHHESERRDKPLVRLNCASLPESLLESELFGYERGAFTGAAQQKRGFFEAAHGGTLFLDEIGELSAAMQAKLLRVLERRRITRVGATEEIAVDVRVVCATNRDLEQESATGVFRSDLYFRISAFTIFVPPLRDRIGEILPLAEQFLRASSRNDDAPPVLSPAAAVALQTYAWPGNVRELRNTIEHACVMQSGGVIDVDDLPEQIVAHRSTTIAATVDATSFPYDVRDRMARLERDALLAALHGSSGNQTEAAKRLGVSRRALIYKLEKHGLKPQPASRR